MTFPKACRLHACVEWPEAAFQVGTWTLVLSTTRHRLAKTLIFFVVDDVPQMLPATRIGQARTAREYQQYPFQQRYRKSRTGNCCLVVS